MDFSYGRRNRVLANTAILFCAAYWICVLTMYHFMPEQIPMHFDAGGDHTRMAAKTWGSWLLSPLILTTTAGIVAILMWRFLSIGIENYNFPFKNEVLELKGEQKKQFETVLRGFLTFASLASVLYLFSLGLILLLNKWLYVNSEFVLPVLLITVLLTTILVIVIIVEYRKIKSAFRKQLDSASPQG